MDQRPNFVLIMPDSLRAESIACYGHPLVQTPNMDRLSREGVRFDNCYCQYPVCGPSRCSMMTGLYPHNTGCRTNEFFLHPHQPSLLRYLKEAGYHVEWHGKNDLYSQDSLPLACTRVNQPAPGAHRHRVFGTHGAKRIAPQGQVGGRSFLCEPFGDVESYHDVYTVDDAVHWLHSREADAPPFALYLALGLPHPPYTAPPEFYHMYAPGDVPELRPRDLPDRPALHRHLRDYLQLDEAPDEMLRLINAVYLGMVSYFDWILGRLLDALDRLDLADNTVVVLLSDHGDYGGDYGLVHKNWATMEDVHVRVPFIFRGPGIARSHSVAEPIELFDLMATCLELAGIPCAHAHFARSLVPQLLGAPGDSQRLVFSEGGIGAAMEYCLDPYYEGGILIGNPDSFYHPQALCTRDHPEITACTTMLRTATHKLVYRPRTESELYDMSADPRELHNLYGKPEHAEMQQRLERMLLDWLIETSDTTPRETDSRGAPAWP